LDFSTDQMQNAEESLEKNYFLYLAHLNNIQVLKLSIDEENFIRRNLSIGEFIIPNSTSSDSEELCLTYLDSLPFTKYVD
jgi:hypothetical protein